MRKYASFACRCWSLHFKTISFHKVGRGAGPVLQISETCRTGASIPLHDVDIVGIHFLLRKEIDGATLRSHVGGMPSKKTSRTTTEHSRGGQQFGSRQIGVGLQVVRRLSPKCTFGQCSRSWRLPNEIVRVCLDDKEALLLTFSAEQDFARAIQTPSVPSCWPTSRFGGGWWWSSRIATKTVFHLLVAHTCAKQCIKDVSHACSLFSMRVLQSGSCGLRGARGQGGDHHLATTSNGATGNTKNAM